MGVDNFPLFGSGGLVAGSQPYDLLSLILALGGRLTAAQGVSGLGTKMENRAQQQQNQQRLDDLISGIQGSLSNAGESPMFTLGGTALTGPAAGMGPQSGGPVMAGAAPDLEDIFVTGRAGQAAFNRLFPSNQDLTIGPSNARGDVASTIANAQRNIGNLSQGGIDRIFSTLDTDLSDVLSGNLSGIAQASLNREQQARQELASRAGFFGGLENTQGQERAISFGEAQQRGSEAAAERGRVRAQEAGLQSDAAQLATALTQAQMQEEGALARTEAGAIPGLTGLDLQRQEGNLQRLIDRAVRGMGAEVGVAEDTQNQGLKALDLMIGSQGMDLQRLQTILQTQLGLGQILGGTGLLNQDVISLLPLLQSLKQQQMLSQQGQGGGNYGGIGTAAGMGLGALLALPTGGVSVAMGGLLGGMGGGAAGSFFQK